MELRYLIRNGEKVLQYRSSHIKYTTSGVIGLPVEVFDGWNDVETVREITAIDKFELDSVSMVTKEDCDIPFTLK